MEPYADADAGSLRPPTSRASDVPARSDPSVRPRVQNCPRMAATNAASASSLPRLLTAAVAVAAASRVPAATSRAGGPPRVLRLADAATPLRPVTTSAVTTPAGTTYNGCAATDLGRIMGPMAAADADGSGFLSKIEYVEFADALSGGFLTAAGRAGSFLALPLRLQETYLLLSCLCDLFPNQAWGGAGCCKEESGGAEETGIRTAGTGPGGPPPTRQERLYLKYVCGTVAQSLVAVGGEMLDLPTGAPATSSAWPSGTPTAGPTTATVRDTTVLHCPVLSSPPVHSVPSCSCSAGPTANAKADRLAYYRKADKQANEKARDSGENIRVQLVFRTQESQRVFFFWTHAHTCYSFLMSIAFLFATQPPSAAPTETPIDEPSKAPTHAPTTPGPSGRPTAQPAPELADPPGTHTPSGAPSRSPIAAAAATVPADATPSRAPAADPAAPRVRSGAICVGTNGGTGISSMDARRLGCRRRLARSLRVAPRSLTPRRPSCCPRLVVHNLLKTFSASVCKSPISSQPPTPHTGCPSLSCPLWPLRVLAFLASHLLPPFPLLPRPSPEKCPPR